MNQHLQTTTDTAAETAEVAAEVGARGVDELSFLRACDPEFVWEPPWKGVFLRGLRVQPNVTAASRLAGVSPQAAYQQQKNDPLFAAVWADAKRQSVDLLSGYVHRMSTEGLPQNETRTTVKRQLNAEGRMVTVEETTVTVEGTLISPQTAMFLLRAHDPKQYIPPERRELSGPDGAPVAHAIYRPPNEERLLALARLAVEQAELDAAAAADPTVIDGEAELEA